jgi:uncharacterized protein with PIN domain
MPSVAVRFYGELNDFLPVERRQRPVVHRFSGTPSVKVLIESLAVPHPEVDLILLDGEPVDFAVPVPDGARLAVYPRFRALDPGPARLTPPDPDPPQFVLDGHLGRLARYQRLLGFDTRYDPAAAGAALARRATAEGRILLTQDRGLLERREVSRGYLVRASDPRRQLLEVVRRFDLLGAAEPFCRCLRCNGLLDPVPRDAVLDRLEPKTHRYYDRFWRCDGCGRVYWQGSPYQCMRALVGWLRRELEPDAPED